MRCGTPKPYWRSSVHLRIYDTGEPSAVNAACSVWEGAVGKGPEPRAPRWRPTSRHVRFGGGAVGKGPAQLAPRRRPTLPHVRICEGRGVKFPPATRRSGAGVVPSRWRCRPCLPCTDLITPLLTEGDLTVASGPTSRACTGAAASSTPTPAQSIRSGHTPATSSTKAIRPCRAPDDPPASSPGPGNRAPDGR